MGDTNGKPAYLSNDWDYELSWDGAKWIIISTEGIYYFNTQDTEFPPSEGWQTNLALDPTDTPPNLSGGVTLLPVELTSFTANVNKNEVTLNWQTATEVNNYGIEIERSVHLSFRVSTANREILVGKKLVLLKDTEIQFLQKNIHL